jgi:hypothetical protein
MRCLLGVLAVLGPASRVVGSFALQSPLSATQQDRGHARDRRGCVPPWINLLLKMKKEHAIEPAYAQDMAA